MEVIQCYPRARAKLVPFPSPVQGGMALSTQPDPCKAPPSMPAPLLFTTGGCPSLSPMMLAAAWNEWQRARSLPSIWLFLGERGPETAAPLLTSSSKQRIYSVWFDRRMAVAGTFVPRAPHPHSIGSQYSHSDSLVHTLSIPTSTGGHISHAGTFWKWGEGNVLRDNSPQWEAGRWGG